MRPAALAALLLGGALSAQPEPPPAFDLDAFEAHLRALGAGEAVLEDLRREVDELGAAAAADEALRAVAPEYDAAVRAAEGGEPRAALALAEIVAGGDPFLRAHARYHLGRVFLDGGDPERAAAILAELLAEDRGRTPLDADALFFHGVAAAEIPRPESALESFRALLALHPDAPRRMLAVAEQQIAELERRRQDPLHGIADVMKGVERRIRRTDTGADTQERQQEIEAKLTEILRLLEEQERSGGGVGGLSPPSAPAGRSAAPAGATRIGDLGRVPNVVDRWGDLQDRDREAIETALQTRLPAHYRRMLEEYYRKLGTRDR